PAISIIGYHRIINVILGTVLIIYAIEKSVEHDIAAVDTRFSQKALYSMTSHADQDAADHRLVFGLDPDRCTIFARFHPIGRDRRSAPTRRETMRRERPTGRVLAHKASQRVRGRYRDRTSAFWNPPPVRLPEETTCRCGALPPSIRRCLFSAFRSVLILRPVTVSQLSACHQQTQSMSLSSAAQAKSRRSTKPGSMSRSPSTSTAS